MDALGGCLAHGVGFTGRALDVLIPSPLPSKGCLFVQLVIVEYQLCTFPYTYFAPWVYTSLRGIHSGFTVTYFYQEFAEAVPVISPSISRD